MSTPDAWQPRRSNAAIRRFLRIVGFVMPCFVLVTTVGCASGDASAPTIGEYRERLGAIRNQDFPQTIRITDRHGELLTEVLGEGHRVWLPLNDIPLVVRSAVIATEDRTFYQNHGVDKRAVARAMVQNARAGGIVSGASTITMQLVRMVAFPPEERYEQSLERKVREVHLAAELDESMSKDEILEAYLNVAFFGRHAYGIETAAQRFFGLHARDLPLAEASYLVGLLQAPAALGPESNPGAARRRQRVVLDSMVEIGTISAREADRAYRRALRFIPAPPLPARSSSHFIDYVLATLPETLGALEARRGGYTVRTTLDPDLEGRAREIARRHVASLRDAHDISDAAVVIVRPGSGEILSMIGGIDYGSPVAGQVNVATSGRQPGSAFKPILYATALDRGWTPATLMWDVPMVFGEGSNTYTPTNYDGRFRGPVRLRRSLANSLNAAAVGLTAEVGLEAVHRNARRLGLSLDRDPWRYGLSLALGGGESTLLELTSALGTFGNQGRHVPTTAILEVTRIRDGAVLFRHEPAPESIVSPQNAWLISDILDDDDARVPAFGADNPLAASRPAAVKTGTTNDFRDNLTVGWTPWVSVGVWTGNKDGRPMRDVLGITGAAPIWREIMESIFADSRVMSILGDGTPARHGFPIPAGITQADICRIDAIRRDGSCERYRESFARGTPMRDELLTFAWFDDRDGCGVRASRGDGTRLALLVPRDRDIAQDVRDWSRARGLSVAPVPCSGPTARHAPALGVPNTVGQAQ